MANKIKVVSLNIENHKHLDLVIPFLKQSQPDIILLQEVFADDATLFEKELGLPILHAPQCLKTHFDPQVTQLTPWGVAILTKLPVINTSKTYYADYSDPLPVFNRQHPEEQSKVLLEATVEKDGQKYTFLNTHFTWTPKGLPTDKQREDLKKLLNALQTFPEFIFMGDLNAPRGTEVFDQITTLYKDNIPPSITTTIDKNFHKAGDLQYVVDALFTTPQYIAQNVTVTDGISDHCAIQADISIK